MLRSQLLLVALFATCFCGAQTVVDIDGHSYPTVIIGTQEWMAENLRSTRYQNGDTIPNVTASLVWDDLTTGGRCYYDNDSAQYAATYGALYNWYAMTDPRNPCPEGWHVPNDHEWDVLAYYLDPTVDPLTNNYTGTDVGGQLREAGTAHWDPPNVAGSNSSGFTALPGGERFGGGQFHYLHTEGVWWTSSQGNAANHGWYRHLHTLLPGIQAITYFKLNGMACRCISDLSTSTAPVRDGPSPMRLYPVPVADRLCVTGLPASPCNAQVLDLFGQRVAQHTVRDGSACIDIKDLAPGVYVLRIAGAGSEVSQRFVKE